MLHQTTKLKRFNRIRRKVVNASPGLPRLSIFKSNKHIFAQIINDKNGNVLAAFHSQTIKDKLSKRQKAEIVGQKIAALALKKNIINVKFDRGGYRYHGCVKILADSARSAGLHF